MKIKIKTKIISLFSISILIFLSCQTKFQFGKYRSDKGYEYEFYADSTFCWNGYNGEKKCESEGIAQIKKRKIILNEATNYKKPRTFSNFYTEITLLGMTKEDSSSLTLNFFYYNDSIKTYNQNALYDFHNKIYVKYLNEKKREWQVSYSYRFDNQYSATIKIPVQFKKYKMNLHGYYFGYFYYDKMLSDCYNYNINVYCKRGDFSFDGPYAKSVSLKRRKKYFSQVKWGVLWKKETKYYYVEE